MKQYVDIEKVKQLILPILEEGNIELVDIELKGRPGNHILRIFADTDEGITVDQCVRISRDVADLLDTEDLFPGKYRLEVSSPGLDRPLKTYRDFKRNLNRKVKIEFIDEKNEKATATGVIEQVGKDRINIRGEKQTLDICIERILSAKIIPLW